MKNGKIEELSKRTIFLLERTKKLYKNYEKERKLLYSFLVNKNNVEEWEKYINQLERRIK